MSEAGVNLSGLRRISEANTGLALIFLNPKRENSIVIIGGANIFYKNLTILPEEYQKAISECLVLVISNHYSNLNSFDFNVAKRNHARN